MDGTRRDGFELLISQVVVDECRAGDPTAAQERLVLLDSIPVLDVSIDAEKLALELMKQVPLPGKAYLDALHIAIATLNAMDYLLGIVLISPMQHCKTAFVRFATSEAFERLLFARPRV